MYKVKETADLAGVSVRTLHHYDRIGLLQPSETTDAGYRLYDEEDLERLQQILFFKELGLHLADIASILDHPQFQRSRALRRHREFLLAKRQRIDRLLDAVDQTIASLEGGTPMSTRDMFAPFSTETISEHQKKYEQEVKERWGETDAFAESQRRTSQYGKEQWRAIADQSNAIYKNLAALMDQPVQHPQVQAAIARWHQLINDHFYPCSREMFRGLGQMYTADERFERNIDAFGQGLAAFMAAAMEHYCDQRP